MFTKADHHRMKVPFEIACQMEAVANARIASAIYIKNKLVSVGMNQYRTSPFASHYGKNEHAIHYHAETLAIKRAITILGVSKFTKSKTTLYVARAKYVNDDMKYGLAKPCSGCLRAILDYEINKVIYTTNEGGIDAL